jgi:hypothetical protein
MPDMQTALKEALNEWDDSVGRHQVEKQQPTPLPEVTQMQDTPAKSGAPLKPENESARRELFYHIKGNPESSLQDLTDCNFDSGSASTHLSIMYFNGKLSRKAVQVQRPIYGGRIATRDVFVYSTAVAEYDDVPAMLPNKKAKKVVHRKIKPVEAAPQAQGIAALPTEVKQERVTRIPRPPMETLIGQPTPRPEFVPQPEVVKPKGVLTAAYVIDNISLSEAVLLHAELKKMLG